MVVGDAISLVRSGVEVASRVIQALEAHKELQSKHAALGATVQAVSMTLNDLHLSGNASYLGQLGILCAQLTAAETTLDKLRGMMSTGKSLAAEMAKAMTGSSSVAGAMHAELDSCEVAIRSAHDQLMSMVQTTAATAGVVGLNVTDPIARDFWVTYFGKDNMHCEWDRFYMCLKEAIKEGMLKRHMGETMKSNGWELSADRVRRQHKAMKSQRRRNSHEIRQGMR